MKLITKILYAAILTTCLPAPRGQAAEDEFTHGSLQAVRLEDRTVVLDNVRVYVPEDVADLKELVPGDEVVYEYTRRNGRLTAFILRKDIGD